jgi:hypothetical protein
LSRDERMPRSCDAPAQGLFMPESKVPGPGVRQDAAWLLAIGLTGAVLRLAFAWQYTREPLGQYAWVDESSYWTWAQTIAQGGWWPVRPFYQDPLYPYWLACVMGVAGSDVARLRLASAGLGAFTPVVVACVGRIGLGRIEGLLAGWTTAFFAPLIFADGSLEKEGLATFWTALALGLTGHLSHSGRMRSAATAGAAWGVIGLMRSNALLIGPLAAIWLMSAKFGPKDWSVKQRMVRALACVLGYLMILAPVAAINTAVSRPRELLGTTWQLGPNFYIGNGPEATGTYVALPFVRAHPAYEAADFAMEAIRRVGHHLTPKEVSRYWLDQGLAQWAREPLKSIRLFYRKLALLVHRSEIPDNQDIEFVQIVAAPALRWGVVGFGSVFPLAALGLARAPRTAFWWFLCSATGLGLASTALFFVVGRYRVPWVPGLVLLASAGLVDVGRRARTGDWRGVAWRLGALGLPAAFLCWRALPDPVPSRWGNQLIALSLANLRADQLDPAIDALDLARASSPAMAEKARQLASEGPFHDLLAASVDRALAQGASVAAGSQETTGRGRLLRQLPARRAEARSILRSIVDAYPSDTVANREWGAMLLTWPRSPDDRTRAVEALGRASDAPIADDRAVLLWSLATGNPALLDRGLVAAGPQRRRFINLVRAMLDSRGNRSLRRRSLH